MSIVTTTALYFRLDNTHGNARQQTRVPYCFNKRMKAELTWLDWRLNWWLPDCAHKHKIHEVDYEKRTDCRAKFTQPVDDNRKTWNLTPSRNKASRPTVLEMNCHKLSRPWNRLNLSTLQKSLPSTRNYCLLILPLTNDLRALWVNNCYVESTRRLIPQPGLVILNIVIPYAVTTGQRPSGPCHKTGMRWRLTDTGMWHIVGCGSPQCLLRYD